jgi:co-chaperonin GroES (HSP10)
VFARDGELYVPLADTNFTEVLVALKSRRETTIPKERNTNKMTIELPDTTDRASEHAKAREECFLIPTNSPPRLVVARDGFHYSGKLVIPDSAKARPTTGYVIAVPPNGEFNYWLGRRVLFAPMSGTDVKFKASAPWIVLQIEEIICEITKSNAELDSEFLERGL